MVSAASAAGFADLVAGIMALEIFFFLDPQSGTSTAPSAQAPLLYSALELLLPLGVAGSFTAVGYIHHHLSRRHAHAAVPATGATNRRVSGVAFSILCVSVGVLHYYFFFFVQPAGGAVDHAARARGIGLGALRALPTAAMATFFWGMMLIVIAHVCAGGEGGGGAVAGAGQGATIQSSLRLLTKIAVGAAAGLAFLVAIAFCIKC